MVSWLFLFFLRSITFPSIIFDLHASFVSDDANVLVKVVAIFGVISREPATAHSVFCYSAVAHISTRSETLAFTPKSGFKNNCRARACDFGLGPVQASKWALLQLYVVLRSEIPSDMCAKLRTVAASNNKDHAPQLLLARATYTNIMVLFFTHIPFVVNHTINATPSERLQQSIRR